MSIARAHFQRTMAARESAAASSGAEPATGSAYERMLGQLRLHQAQLKAIQSKTAKIETKKGFLAEYAPYVDGVIAGGGGAQDDVLATVMVWRLDAGDWDGGLEIAAYGIRHGLAMPEPFRRDLPTTLVEELADAVLTTTSPDKALADPINEALELTADQDMVDEVRAKAHKALGLIALDSAPAVAIEHFEAALKLNPNSGVKTQLTRARKALPPAS